MRTETKDIINKYLQSFSDQSTSLLEEICLENLNYEGPTDQTEGRNSFIQSVERNLGLYSGHNLKHVLEDGDKLCLIYDLVPTTAGKRPLTFTDVLWLENGKIKNVKQNFDATDLRRINTQI